MHDLAGLGHWKAACLDGRPVLGFNERDKVETDCVVDEPWVKFLLSWKLLGGEDLHVRL